MTIQDQQFLIATLNLASKLRTNDTTVIDDITTINTYAGLTDNHRSQIDDLLRVECEQAKELNKDLLKTAINSFPFTDQQYLYELIDFALIDESDWESMKAYVNTALSKPLIFKVAFHEFNFYSLIVNSCIFIKDPVLTKKAIDKLQSLHTV